MAEVKMKATTNFKGSLLRKGTLLTEKDFPAEVLKRWINNGLAKKITRSKKENDK